MVKIIELRETPEIYRTLGMTEEAKKILQKVRYELLFSYLTANVDKDSTQVLSLSTLPVASVAYVLLTGFFRNKSAQVSSWGEDI